jgi:hypothetical protein
MFVVVAVDVLLWLAESFDRPVIPVPTGAEMDRATTFNGLPRDLEGERN